eukprot:490414_1
METMKKIVIRVYRVKAQKSALILWDANHTRLNDHANIDEYLKENKERIAKSVECCDSHLTWMIGFKKTTGRFEKKVILDSLSYPLCNPEVDVLSLRVDDTEDCDLCSIHKFGGNQKRLKKAKPKKSKKSKKKRRKRDDSDEDSWVSGSGDSTASDEYDASKEKPRRSSKEPKAKRNPKIWSRFMFELTKKHQSVLTPEGIVVFANRCFDNRDASNIDIDVIPADIRVKYGIKTSANCGQAGGHNPYKGQRTTHENWHSTNSNSYRQRYESPQHRYFDTRSGFDSGHVAHYDSNYDCSRASPYFQGRQKPYQSPPQTEYPLPPLAQGPYPDRSQSKQQTSNSNSYQYDVNHHQKNMPSPGASGGQDDDQ